SIQALATKLGHDVVLLAEVAPDEAWPRFSLRRSAWPEETETAGVSVALEWKKGSAVLTNGEVPYIGLRSFRTDPLGAALLASEAVKKVKADRKEKATEWWVGYGYVLPGPEFP